MDRTKSIFAFGSALLTESISRMSYGDVNVIESVSRQSLISSMSIPWLYNPKYLSDEAIKPWQLRMLRGDFESSLPSQIHEHSLETDLILIDIVDERFGVFRDTSDNFVTDSVILRNLRFFPDVIKGFSRIPFGTDSHFDLWTKSVDEFSKFLSSIGMMGKIVVVKNYWATSTRKGSLIGSDVIKGDPEQINSAYARYFDFLEFKVKFKVLEIPQRMCVANLNHKWGKSFINYETKTYEFVANEISNILGLPHAV